ncbi:MAG: hypothetical protein JXB05_16845 [Myxococcaceae bacterium]|nr:hypothetical protein [Myxococcaceae bacterium]
MKKFLKVGLIGLALGAAAGVASATVGSEETVAPFCCDDCDPGYNTCISGCSTSSCYDSCERIYDSCVLRCIDC